MKLRNLLRPHREGREEMESMADAKIATPAMLGPVPKEFAETVRHERPVRPQKPLIRCKVCKVVTTLPVCVLCVTRGYGDQVDGVVDFVKPYDQEDETQVLERFLINNRRREFVPDVTFENGWRHDGGKERVWDGITERVRGGGDDCA